MALCASVYCGSKYNQDKELYRSYQVLIICQCGRAKVQGSHDVVIMPQRGFTALEIPRKSGTQDTFSAARCLVQYLDASGDDWRSIVSQACAILSEQK